MNISSKIIAGSLAVGVLFSSCNGFNCVSGSGNQVSETRDVGSFTRVETSGSIKVILKQGPVNSLKITADDNIMKELETYVRGNRLIIDLDGSFCDVGPITVFVTSKEYQGIEASGAVEILGDGKLTVNDFDLDLSGSSKVDLEINAANVKTSSSGASEIFLKGQAGSHELDLSGSSSVDALDFVVGRYRIESSGASDSRINVLNELEISSSGSSDVQYRGNPTKIKNDESGASSLKKID
ncbi:head GIN domain-containing protein [Daejeonella lutea]|uniref:Putative auto-transporter adhesin, head GIN domain n=1 Tax=Daejeonella lutea TaxID=572036 RepID=A0A1T5AE49_9SPHI|nr:head GIN domain-containing protein [Daejeonella lutea]SKB33312.1 Putative auto-transporter adhesin, head GIN domain [Daejeonella lutea]